MISRMVAPPAGRSLRILLAAIAVVSVAACSPKAPPPPPPTTSAEPVAKPEVKKKPCEAMNEECVASGDTQAKIPSSDFVFIPPTGWTFAQESGQTIAKLRDQPLAIAVTGLELPKAPGDQAKTRDALVLKLAESVGVSLPKKGSKPFATTWAQPADPAAKYGSTTYAIWQNTEAKLGDKGGLLLIFTTKDSTGKEIVGLAFCPNDEKSIALIQKSLETFGPGSYQ
jgi:hypothetical protein